MNFSIELVEKPAQPVLFIRTRTAMENLPDVIGKAYAAIMGYMNEIGEAPSDAPYTAYYNMDMENLDVEMGFPVSKELPGKGEIKFRQIPAGKQVSCMYKGPYKDMAVPYDAMNQWMKEKGFTPTGESYEYYYNSPMEVPESELLTKIMFPVK